MNDHIKNNIKRRVVGSKAQNCDVRFLFKGNNPNWWFLQMWNELGGGRSIGNY